MDFPFTSDGCSAVLDLDQRACCIRHDWAYWKGGGWRDRLKADNELYRCIRTTSRYRWLAPIRWFGVRIGGLKFWRVERVSWNFGWKNFQSRGEVGAFTESSESPKFAALLKGARAAAA